MTPLVAAGYYHSVAIKSDGSLWAWGSNSYGQLGDRTKNDHRSPVQIEGVYSAVAPGVYHTVALKPDGSLWAWGSNIFGQLGAPSPDDCGPPSRIDPCSLQPMQVGVGYIAIAAGNYHTVALKSDGTLWAWGKNLGVLGDGSRTDSLIPVQVAGEGGQGYLRAATASLSPLSLTFATQSVGAVSAPSSVTLSNTGELPLSISAINASGDFQQSHNCGAGLAGGASCTIDIHFSPSAMGARTGSLTVASNAAGSPHSVSLNGGGAVALGVTRTGAGSVTSSPAGIDCGTVCTAEFEPGASVTLTAAAAAGYQFAGWSGACSGTGACTVTMDAASSVAASFADALAPSVPGGLTAGAASSSQINLSWTASNDNVGVTQYRIYRDTDSYTAPIAAVTAATLTYSNTGLTAATAHSYKVAACDAVDNCSVQSAIATATTLDDIAPTVPTGMTATGFSSSQINLAWTLSTDNVGVTQYKVYRSTDNYADPIATVTAPAVAFSDTGLTSATAYSYKVAACDAASNCSVQSAAASATTLDNIAPTLPTGLKATAVSSSQINLSWTASSDNVGVTHYKIYRNASLLTTLSGTPPGTNYSDTGLAALTGYSYTVQACDAAANCTEQSASASATTFDATAPSLPTGLSASAFLPSQINLSWTASSDNVGVTQYKIYRNGLPLTTLSGTPPATSYSDTGLAASTSYSYAVQACDAALNCSAHSVSASAITPAVPDTTPPAIISGPSVTAITDRAAVVQWQTSEPATSVVNYGIGGLGSPPASTPGLVSIHSVPLSGLNPQTTYNVQVVTADAAGNVTTSAQIAFTTRTEEDKTPPVIVSGPSVVAIGPNQATVEWATNEATTGTVSYGTSVGLGSTAASSTPKLAHRVTLTGLTASTRYYLQIAATDSAGNGPTLSARADFYSAAAPDTTPPRYTKGPLVVDVSDTTLTVQLATDEPASVTITLESAQPTRTIQYTDLRAEQSIRIQGLSPSTAYTVTVGVTDELNNGPRQSAPLPVTTRAAPDTLAPIFVETPSVCHRSRDSAMLCWKTDEPADARVNFGTLPGTLDNAETRSTLQLVQSVTLTGLSPGTMYYYSARSADGSGNAAQSALASFSTDALPDTTPPVFVMSPQVVYASGDRVVIEWETDEPTQAVIEWGPNTQRTLRLYEPGGATRHQVTLTNLLPNTEYFVRVVASDAAGNATPADVP